MKYGTMKYLVLLLLLTPLSAAAQTGSIRGTVTDASTQEPLVGAGVLVQGTEQGAATGLDGTFRIDGLAAGTYRLAFRYLGYTSFIQTDVVVRPGRTTAVNVSLREAVLEGEGVTVTAGYYQKNDTELTSVASFSNEEIRRAPGAAQEVTRVLMALPSVASRGEDSQDLFVRGGSPMENAFYIDGVFVPNAQHFVTNNGSSFGPIGIINTMFIEEIDFYTGGFSAAYGDRASSVSNIRYREGNRDRLGGILGMNMSGGTAVLEGPWADQKGTWFFSARRSYLDLIAEAIDAGGAPRFGDVQGKATLDLNPRHTLSLLSLNGWSAFVQTADDAREDGIDEYFDISNRQHTAGLTWRALWRGDGYSTTALSYSERHRDLVSRLTASDARLLDESIRSQFAAFRNVNYYSASARLKLEFGGEVMAERGTFDYEQDAFVSHTGTEQPGFDRDLRLRTVRTSAFASAITRPLPRLQLTLGLRGDFDALNEDAYLSPRLAASYQLAERLSLNASAGIFRQAVPLYISSQDPANENLPHFRADHYIVGLDYLLTPDTRLTLEAYAKEYRDLPQYAASNTLGDPGYLLDNRGDYTGGLESGGEAYARGLELLIQKKLAEKLYGMASASIFRSRYADYRGQWHNRAYDTRTLLSAVGGYKPNDTWELSIRWSYSGGRPYTPIDVERSLALNTEVIATDRFHAERLPAYHALYLRADRRFMFRRANVVTYLSLWNAYNRSNVETRYWNFDLQQVDDATLFSVLPIFGIEVEF